MTHKTTTDELAEAIFDAFNVHANGEYVRDRTTSGEAPYSHVALDGEFNLRDVASYVLFRVNENGQ